jgi:hypothetical protein
MMRTAFAALPDALTVFKQSWREFKGDFNEIANIPDPQHWFYLYFISAVSLATLSVSLITIAVSRCCLSWVLKEK